MGQRAQRPAVDEVVARAPLKHGGRTLELAGEGRKLPAKSVLNRTCAAIRFLPLAGWRRAVSRGRGADVLISLARDGGRDACPMSGNTRSLALGARLTKGLVDQGLG